LLIAARASAAPISRRRRGRRFSSGWVQSSFPGVTLATERFLFLVAPVIAGQDPLGGWGAAAVLGRARGAVGAARDADGVLRGVFVSGAFVVPNGKEKEAGSVAKEKEADLRQSGVFPPKKKHGTRD
jgi:hypothetical protein